MKYSNQINMFLAITGCIVVLWVVTQTYLQPSQSEQLNIAGIYAGKKESPTNQTPAAYQGEGSTNTKPVAYGAPSRRSTQSETPLVGGSVAGGGTLQSGTRTARTPSSARKPGLSVSRALGSTSTGRTPSSDTGYTQGANNSAPQVRDSDQSRPANVGGFSTPPAGQSLGMEQAKRTPEDSSSGRKYVPFRSSMANRPN